MDSAYDMAVAELLLFSFIAFTSLCLPFRYSGHIITSTIAFSLAAIHVSVSAFLLNQQDGRNVVEFNAYPDSIGLILILCISLSLLRNLNNNQLNDLNRRLMTVTIVGLAPPLALLLAAGVLLLKDPYDPRSRLLLLSTSLVALLLVGFEFVIIISTLWETRWSGPNVSVGLSLPFIILHIVYNLSDNPRYKDDGFLLRGVMVTAMELSVLTIYGDIIIRGHNSVKREADD